MAPLPESRHHFALVPLEGRLYSIGGYPGEGSGFTEEAWAYDPAIDAWEAVASLPAPLGAHAAAALNALIYVVGGVSPIPDAGRTLLIYDPEADSWSTHPELMPTAREHVVAVAFEGQLWVIGGRTGENLDVVEIFDPESGVWTEGPRLATPTSGHTAVVFDGEIHGHGRGRSHRSKNHQGTPGDRLGRDELALGGRNPHGSTRTGFGGHLRWLVRGRGRSGSGSIGERESGRLESQPLADPGRIQRHLGRPGGEWCEQRRRHTPDHAT